MLLDLQNLGESSCMSILGHVTSLQERIDDFECQLGANDPAPNAQDIHIIMLNSLVSRVGIVTNRSSDTRNFIGRHAYPYTTPTNHDAAICPAFNNFFGNRDSKVRIVTTLAAVGTTVSQRDYCSMESLSDNLLEGEACVITAESNTQRS